MQAAVLSVGDELVLGQTVDTNSAFLSGELAQLGIMTRLHHTVADELGDITRMIQQTAEQVPLILISGGLGPTDDDMTRQALAEAMGVELVLDPECLCELEAFFAKRKRPMPSVNRVQAYHPQGTTLIPNRCGTAPGICATLGNTTIYVVPGVPSEMKQMWLNAIKPALQARIDADRKEINQRFILTRKINTFGLGESALVEKLGSLCDRTRNPLVGTTVSHGVVSIRIRSDFSDRNQAQKELEQTSSQIQACLGEIVFSQDDVTLQEALVALLRKNNKTLATAESCTGGLIGKMLADVPGASAVWLGGWVTYANAMKCSQLEVNPDLIDTYGAVSREVACAMAQGALRHAGSDLAISVTGIAGPDGGTPEKPVGTVWIALAQGTQVRARCFCFGGDRQTVRDRAAKAACQMLRWHLLGVSNCSEEDKTLSDKSTN